MRTTYQSIYRQRETHLHTPKRRHFLSGKRLGLFTLLILMLSVTFGSIVQAWSGGTEDPENMLQVIVQPGDTVWALAKEYMNDGDDIRQHVHDILQHNNLVGRHLQVGEIIEIPFVSSLDR
ncbi:LysM peptidoglycan-binding domain-containing protein [Paenibacillus assamensis]|uniref:LysM peptidoglycan-binding domain-containing protein n=1 Tax=Paenibacillus assamensis TaxID=311244 RepID=UPI000561BFD7|nr:LysM peptidoglycan-binding domain-containing protein [Paenibacillus assamensis]